jgi:hypothetical protein
MWLYQAPLFLLEGLLKPIRLNRSFLEEQKLESGIAENLNDYKT